LSHHPRRDFHYSKGTGGRGIELAFALVQRGAPVNYGPVRAREDKLNWIDGGALEDLPRPFSAERNAIHYTRVGPSPE
jgi:hypothetical protein